MDWDNFGTFKFVTKIPRVIDSLIIIARVFPSGGLGDPHELHVPPNNSCVPPIFVEHDKIFCRYFLNFCMTMANLTSITSLRMQTLLSY